MDVGDFVIMVRSVWPHHSSPAASAAARQVDLAILGCLRGRRLRRGRDQGGCHQADGQGAGQGRCLEIGFAVHLTYPQPELR